MSKVAHSVIAKLQAQMFEKLMYLNLNYFNDSKSGNLISGLAILKCTSFAPASYNIPTILWDVVPLTKESSTNIIDLFLTILFVELNFNFTPK